ncbi:MAG: SRPBCC family protein [Halobacteriales archaeon]|nr:SRPBCC family protein [Halobacteriales archaeon]
MPSRWSFEAEVAASPDDAYAWMTDYTADDHGSPAFLKGSGMKPSGKASVRRIKARAGNRLDIEDAWGRQRFETTVTLVPGSREVRIEGQWGYRSTWRALPAKGGSRIVCEARLEPSGAARLLAPLFARMLMGQMRADFQGHVAEMRHDLAGKG